MYSSGVTRYAFLNTLANPIFFKFDHKQHRDNTNSKWPASSSGQSRACCLSLCSSNRSRSLLNFFAGSFWAQHTFSLPWRHIGSEAPRKWSVIVMPEIQNILHAVLLMGWAFCLDHWLRLFVVICKIIIYSFLESFSTQHLPTRLSHLIFWEHTFKCCVRL